MTIHKRRSRKQSSKVIQRTITKLVKTFSMPFSPFSMAFKPYKDRLDGQKSFSADTKHSGKQHIALCMHD